MFSLCVCVRNHPFVFPVCSCAFIVRVCVCVSEEMRWPAACEHVLTECLVRCLGSVGQSARLSVCRASRGQDLHTGEDEKHMYEDTYHGTKEENTLKAVKTLIFCPDVFYHTHSDMVVTQRHSWHKPTLSLSLCTSYGFHWQGLMARALSLGSLLCPTLLLLSADLLKWCSYRNNSCMWRYRLGEELELRTSAGRASSERKKIEQTWRRKEGIRGRNKEVG